MPTKKQLIQDVKDLATRFGQTDDSRLSDRWISYKLDHIRAEKIIRNYKTEETVDFAWYSQPFFIDFYKVNIADDPNLMYCCCEISKTTIPPVISLTNPNSTNQDVGIHSLFSACGKYAYYPRPVNMWANLPAEHTFSKFNWYARYNTTLYVKGTPTRLRLAPILLYPEDGFLINTQPVASGNIVSGTQYIVKFGNVTYNGITYYGDDNTKNTFTGAAATTYVGSGKVYLYNTVSDFEATDPYPIGGEMAREIVIEILTKEFMIEENAVADFKNDSIDDQKQVKAPTQ